MPKLFKGHTWLSRIELEAYGISKNTIKAGLDDHARHQRPSWIFIICPESKKPIVRFDSIPLTSRAKLPKEEHLIKDLKEDARSRVADRDELETSLRSLASSDLLSMLKLNPTEILELQKDGFTPEQAGQIGRLSAWMRLANGLTPSDFKKLGLKGKQSALKAVMEAMAGEYADGILHGRSIANLDVFYRKLKAYREEGIMSLIHGNTGNDHAQKMSDHHAHALLKAYKDNQKRSKWSAYERYSHYVVNDLGEQAIGWSSAKAFLHKYENELVAALSRFNKRERSAHYTPHIHRRRPDYCLDLVVGDGFTFGETVRFPKGHFLLDPKVQSEKEGQLNVWVWYDAKSEAILSWDVAKAPGEPFEMIRSSFRDIAKLHGHLPVEVKVDQRTARNTLFKQMASNCGVALFEKEAYEPKSLLAERFNQELKRLHKESPGWLDITTNNHKNARERANLPEGWEKRTVDEMLEFIAETIRIYNAEPKQKFNGKSRMACFLANISPDAKAMDEMDRLFAFGVTREVTLRTNWIKFEEGKQTYEYLVPASAIVGGMCSKDMLARWDEGQPETILLFTLQNEFVCECASFGRHNMAQSRMTDADRKSHEFQQTEKGRFEQAVKSLSEENDDYSNLFDIKAGLEHFGQERKKQALNDEMTQHMADHYSAKYGFEKKEVRESELVELENPDFKVKRTKKKSLLDL